MIRAVCDDNGRRWRVEGPGWTMQPEGTISAGEAETICRSAAHALTLNDGVTAEADSLAPHEHAIGRTLPERLDDLARHLEHGPDIQGFIYALTGEQILTMSAALWRYTALRDASQIIPFDKGQNTTLHTLACAIEDFAPPIRGAHHFAAAPDRVQLIVEAIREQARALRMEFKDRRAVTASANPTE